MLFHKESFSRKVFTIFNYIFLSVCTIVCVFPILHILAVSFSSSTAVNAGKVIIWPVEFQINTYEFVTKGSEFYSSFMVTVERTVLSVLISMILTVLAGYPLSMSQKQFKGREFYKWFFMITMLFNGGLIPTYLVVSNTGLIDSIWALVIPCAVPVFNIILIQNFFKGIPYEISESAALDRAGHMTILFKLIVPLSKPVLATLTLFVAVNHWNAWFDGMLYMNRPENYPLQTYLRTIVVEINLETVTDLSVVESICQKNSKAAQIIIAMVPILCVYPFLQKYFTKGIILGSVKG